ncbi:hypothetical protein ACJO5Y_18170 [Marinobacter sp. GN3S48]|uniref:hypothetical protein n=1 Tax=Marinobacter sp. GN3S48 TaxID=3382302 RepID=UPI00387A9471
MKLALLLAIVILLQGCDSWVGHRSGSIDDDYIEEPLSGRSAEYQLALETSNQILTMIRDGRCNSVYETFLSDTGRVNIDLGRFRSMCDNINSQFGSLSKYKPNQWHFFIASDEDESEEYLLSIKIAEHKKTMINYAFIFPADGPYKKIVGIHLKPRQGTLMPGRY